MKQSRSASRKKDILYEGGVKEKDVVLYFGNSAIVQRFDRLNSSTRLTDIDMDENFIPRSEKKIMKKRRKVNVNARP